MSVMKEMVVRLALKAGFDIDDRAAVTDASVERLERFAALVAEESARLCDDRAAYYRLDDDGPFGVRSRTCTHCAGVIRYWLARELIR